ncbi:hypothetical protein B5F17_00200 [Butyricicoccus pullicaecorum]|uniref:Uncharacterized protein n=1 Tax=Butyricicoccus pullicaecorum TaxID=501571 RepID=A0A1Y4LCB6_9FIRM|nr:hypothetical protein [Butyricicoccus pullicaecorum]OUP54354.1 hypothetical protein B5F17_00200 [Butyricicoccus pullicaecorum]OUP60256.1 hypothetical protein B5F15_03070 [Butyricicoccus pullicaecorum]
MCVTFYTAKCPESLIYARFWTFFVQSALRGGRLLVEKPQFFDDINKAQLYKLRFLCPDMPAPRTGGRLIRGADKIKV